MLERRREGELRGMRGRRGGDEGGGGGWRKVEEYGERGEGVGE